jgi:hypothetical protein
VDFKPRKDS